MPSKTLLLSLLFMALLVLVLFWFQAQNQNVNQLIKAVQGDSECVWDVAYSPDGKWIFTSGEDGLKQWDAKTLKLIQRHPVRMTRSGPSVIYTLAIPNTKPIVYLGGLDQDVQVYNYETRKQLKPIVTRERFYKWVTTVAISEDSRILAIAENGSATKKGVGSPVDEKDFSILLWDLENGKELTRLYGQSPSVRQMEFSADGKKLFSKTDYNTAVWDIAKREIQQSHGSLSLKKYKRPTVTPRHSIAIHADLRNNSQNLGEYADLSPPKSPPTDPTNQKKANATSTVGRLISAGFVDSGEILWGDSEGKLHLFEAPYGRKTKEFLQFSNKMPVECVAISPDGKTAVSGGDGRQVTGMFQVDDERKRNLCLWRLN